MIKEELFKEMIDFFKTADEYSTGDIASTIEWFQNEIKKYERDKEIN